MSMRVEMESYGGIDPHEKVNSGCEFIDLDNCVCRYVEAGLRPGRYADSLCSACLEGLEQLRAGKG